MKIWCQKLLIFMVVAMSQTGCTGTDGAHSLSYPYKADAKRGARILANWSRVVPGMAADKVSSLLGKPDEVNPTYNSIHAKSAKRIGYSYVYVLQRMQATGSVLEKDEKLIRIHFGPDDEVLRVIPVGLSVGNGDRKPGSEPML